MDGGEIEALAQELDLLVEALDEERFRHVAGIEPEPALGRLFAARPRVAHRETLAALRASAEPGAAPLAQRVAALRAERAQADEEEAWRAAEAAASGLGPDGPARLAALELALPRESDPERRAALAAAAAEALEPAAARREAAAEQRAKARAEGGLAPDWRAVVEGDQLLGASDDAWRDVLAWAARRALGAAPERGLARADLLHVLALAEWDGLFRPALLAPAVKRTCDALRLDAGALRVDEADRAAKWPGVHVVGARISYRRRGGAGDWQDLLAGVGRAFAAKGAPPHRRDPVLAGAVAWILGTLTLEPRWLAEHASVEKRHAGDLVRALALRRLSALRLDAAALRLATEVERGLSGAAWREGHREALTAASGAVWDGARASRDADGPALLARVQGAAEGERLRRALRERYDEDWWRNPRSAGHLAGLLAAGRLPEADAPAPPSEAARALVAAMA